MEDKTNAPLLEKPVTRKQFIYMVGLGIAGLSGLSAIAELLTRQHSSKIITQNGFGSGPYGGNAAHAEHRNNRY